MDEYVREDRGWSDFSIDHAEAYPLLARALENWEPATDIRRIVWLLDDEEEARVNYQQIFRRGGDRRAGETIGGLRERLFTEFCGDVERALRHSRAHEDNTTEGGLKFRSLGGVLELLGREPTLYDFIALRPFRDPQWRLETRPGGSQRGEWIAELSLQAMPGKVPA